ncbi:MAG: D-alanyl-D-alanine carboxypeptidase/D-alanyl-D-alanine-endopeptidase [Deltaproteobacteria bacterium]|nr:D-alanyl-D-alanine carboxypeptidase/D-alanyl-D-alanine-endopeptidase [Deltaproteobacteria bacterium]
MNRATLTSVLLFCIFFSISAHSSVIKLAYAKEFKQFSGSPEKSSLYAVWADSGEPVSAFQEDLPLVPASSLKIATAFCALKELGNEKRFTTRFLSDGPIQNSSLKNLWVAGDGDPSLVIERLWLMVQQLKRMGLKTVAGNIYIDNSYFDSETFPGHQKQSQRAFNAPLSAVALNYNAIDISSDPEKPIYRRVDDPVRHFGEELAKLFKENSVTFNGKVKEGSAKNKTEITSFQSRRLNQIVQDMNKFSNNFIAEQLVKVMGAEKKGIPGTTQKGVDVLRECLAKIGVREELMIENGSGLSYKNKISAKNLVKILLAGYHDFSIQPEFLSSLSINGIDGTMAKRDSPKELEGIFRGKTGSLNGVNSLTGFLPAKSGRVIAFAILMNDFNGGMQHAHKVQDKLIMQLLEAIKE